MPTIPLWTLGKNVGSFVLTPQSVDAAGVLTGTTPTVALAGYWKTLRINSQNDTEEISASDQRRKNFVITASGTSIEIEVLIPNTTVSASDVIGAAYGSNDVFKLVVKIGGAGYTFTYYGVVSEFNLTSNGKGAFTGTLSLSMVDPGTANPAIA